jgi:hypothetical protein
MGVQWDSASANFRLQKGLLLRRVVLYNILIDFGVPIKLIRLTEMYLNKSCSNICTGKHLCDAFHAQQSETTKRCFVTTAFQLCFRIHHYERSQWDTSMSDLC